MRGGKKSHEALITKILQHKVVLNLSLADDLNMRNFEALALNRILLTNKVQDHELLAQWEENIVYLDRYPDNPGQAILESLSRTPKDISKEFLSEHGIEARVLRILEVVSGYVPAKDDLGFANRIGSSPMDRVSHESRNLFERAHTPTELLAKSGWLPLGSVLSVIKDSGTRWRGLIIFVSIWIKSFGFHILNSTIGRSSLIRAGLRIWA